MRNRRNAGSWITAAGILVLAGNIFQLLPLQIVFIIGAVGCFVVAVYKAKGLLCKERVNTQFKICTRCKGIYGGLAISFLSVFAISLKCSGLPNMSTTTAIGLVALAFLLDVPTMLHGGIRRLKGETVLDSSIFLFISGGCAGLSVLPFVLAIDHLFS